jgi:hypothetical protein
MENDDHVIEREERGIYLIMVLAGLPILGALLIENRAVDGGNALMLGLVAIGAVGLAAGLKAVFARRLPHARALRSSDRASDSRRPLR